MQPAGVPNFSPALLATERYDDRMGDDTDKTWDQRVFEHIASGVDATIIRANLQLTPTERVEKMLRTLDLVQELRSAHANRSSNGPRRAP